MMIFRGLVQDDIMAEAPCEEPSEETGNRK